MEDLPPDYCFSVQHLKLQGVHCLFPDRAGSVEYLGEASGRNSMQPARFRVKLLGTSPVGQMHQKCRIVWTPFQLRNAFPVETDIGVTHAEVCNEEICFSL